MTKSRRLLVYGLVGAALLAGAAYFIQRPSDTQQNAGRGRFRLNPDQPVPTLVAAAKTADVPIYFDGVGTIKALNTVTVRSQVDGKLLRINFREGQDVERGYVLAEIDDTLYRAALDQSVAKKAQDEAQLENARRDLDRYTKLAATNALAQQQADTQKSLVAQFEALVKADQAAIDNNRATLQYTRIVAPISGRTGIRQVDVGNIVHASDSTGIVILTQLKPISLIFTLPQQQLQQVNAAMTRHPLTVEVVGADNRTATERGTLQVVDNQVDPATGTVKLKAEFANEDLSLWPGQFVNVRLLVDTLKDAIVVPSAAVQRGPNGLFVYVAKDDNTVALRPVQVSEQGEMQTVVTSGLQAGERVATTGFNQLADGSKIAIGTGDGTPPPAAPRNTSQRRRGNAAPAQDSQANPAPPPAAGTQQRSQREGASQSQ